MPPGAEVLDQLADDAARSDASAALLIQDGRLVWSYHPADTSADGLFHIASVTKLVLGQCVARALHLGHIDSLDQPVSTWITEWSSDARAAITLRQLMTHTSGLAVSWPPTGPNSITAAALELQQVANPGETVAYNNHGAQLVAEIIRRATGARVDDFAAARLFAPLGIERWAWTRDSDGLAFGMSGLQLRAEDLGRLGLLSLTGRSWNGARLFSSDRVQRAGSRSPPRPSRRDRERAVTRSGGHRGNSREHECTHARSTAYRFGDHRRSYDLRLPVIWRARTPHVTVCRGRRPLTPL